MEICKIGTHIAQVKGLRGGKERSEEQEGDGLELSGMHLGLVKRLRF